MTVHSESDRNGNVFARFVVEEVYEQGKYDQIRAVFDALEHRLRDGSPEACDLLIACHSLASSKCYSNEVLVPFLGPKCRQIWAQLDLVWRASLGLDLSDCTVLEGEILTWRIVQQKSPMGEATCPAA